MTIPRSPAYLWVVLLRDHDRDLHWVRRPPELRLSLWSRFRRIPDNAISERPIRAKLARAEGLIGRRLLREGASKKEQLKIAIAFGATIRVCVCNALLNLSPPHPVVASDRLSVILVPFKGKLNVPDLD